jgi:hypothetical protein
LEQTNRKTVIFLGAGASAAEKAPTQSQLFATYFAEILPKFATFYQSDKTLLTNMQKDLDDLFDGLFGIKVCETLTDHNPFPTFEEVLGMIQLAIQRGETFQNLGRVDQMGRLRRLEQHLTLLISIVLDAKLREGGGHHRALLDRLGDLKKSNICFISLNYDIVLDNALTLHRMLSPSCFDVDYGIEFTNFRRDRLKRHPAEWEQPRPELAVQLLKPHGSLNWLYCSTCCNVTLTPGEKGVVQGILDPAQYECPECLGQISSIVVLPTFFKVMTNFHLQQVWRKTEAALQTADRIVFCGYSLPDADIHIRYLLKRAELNRSVESVHPDIFVVNSYPGKDENTKKEEQLRFKRSFRHPEKVRYTNLSFEDFAAGGLQVLDSVQSPRACQGI